jgi:outer membrane protein
MKTRILLPLLFLWVVTLTGFAQDVKKQWTLQECIDYALANSLNVKRSEYDVENSEISYSQAKWALAPNLNASASPGSNWGRSINPVTNQFTTQRNNSISPNASSSVMLFNGFRLQYNIKQTSREYQASKEDLQKTKNDVILNVISLYTNVIFSKELYENAKFQLNSSQQQLERIKKQVAAGALSRSNELNQEAQVATNELNVVNRENTVNFTLLQLKQALQLEAGIPLDVVVPEINVEALTIDQSREEVYGIAYQAMPEIRRDNLRVESSQYAIKAAKGNLYPRLTLNGGINTYYSSASETRFVPDGTLRQDSTPYYVGNTMDRVYAVGVNGEFKNTYLVKDQLKDNVARYINISLTIPIFNGFQSKAGVQRSVINKELAAITAKQTANTLRQNIETAYNDAVAASKTYTSSLKQTQAREEAARMVSQRYEAGAANYVEYQVAENDLFQAKSDLVRAKYDFIFRKKLLDFYQGKPIEF